MIKKFSFFLSGLLFLASVQSAQAQTVDYIVTGSKTGSVVLAANLLGKDSDAKLLNSIKLNLNIPGDACKAFANVVKLQDKETFITHSDNLYIGTAELKKDPLCPVPDFSRATPVSTEIQGMYLIVPAAMDVKSLQTTKLKMGFAFDNALYRKWHEKLNATFKQEHTFVGYNGSGSLIKGLLSGEIDAIWQTWTSVAQINSSAPGKFKIVYRTMRERDMESTPVITEVFKDPTLSRGFVSTFWVFNDRDGIADKFRAGLKNLIDTGTGSYGEWAKKTNKDMIYNVADQLNAQKEGWNR